MMSADPIGKLPAGAGNGAAANSANSELNAWWHRLKKIAADQLTLFGLETERAILSLGILLMLSLMAGLILIIIWLSVLAQIFLFSLQFDLTHGQALSITIIVNLLALWAVLTAMKHYRSFPYFRRDR